MQHVFIHSDLQIIKKLKFFTISMCALNMIGRNLQFFGQINMDKIVLATRANRNKNILLGLINPPWSNLVYLVYFPNLGGNYYYTRVWGTHIEVIFHLLHVHA